MKAVFVLIVCSAIGFLEVNSDCVPKELQNFQPEKLSVPLYLIYAKPNLFDQFTNVTEHVHFAGNQFAGNLVLTRYTTGHPETHYNTWVLVAKNTLDVHINGLSEFDSKYKVHATDYTRFLIKAGTPQATNGTEFVAVYATKSCPDDDAVQAIKNAISEQCWNFSEFTVDKSRVAGCPALSN